MELRENVSLKNYTSFFVGGNAKYLLFAQDNEELIQGLEFAEQEKLDVLIFGGGSNILVNDKGFDGLAIRLETVGMDIPSETETDLILRVNSGEVWDDVVRFAVEENFWGIENLSHIPGFAGAIPVQNVGAYGQEASQVIVSVEVYDRKEKVIASLSNEQCEFGYRSSIFNRVHKDRYVILSIDLKLSKIPQPNLSYGDLQKHFGGITNSEVNIEDIRKFVTSIRDLKYPFPSSPEKGNSGSFFRGPILSDTAFLELKDKIEQQFGPESKLKLESMQDKLKVPQGYKTPAAFLIELCGLNDVVVGGAIVNSPQPAVILNYSGEASSVDIIELYKQVSTEVYNLTGVTLGIEPELVGFSEPELATFNVLAAK